eukprot:snap_masked-scaffold1387_size43827-processed-gene-0.4 protein:Tk06623 transcript:snap_masked-scaffold1387_size43827-processed-gene-0.4-mRNA-1 annotation:"galactoside 2-alpha-l-fucosyltransferase 2-like"
MENHIVQSNQRFKRIVMDHHSKLASWILAKPLSKIVQLVLILVVGCLIVKSLIPYKRLEPTEPSRMVSFGRGRLGNQMSSLATLLAFRKEFGIVPLLTREQAHMVGTYFKNINAHVLEEVMPNHWRYHWSNPFKLVDAKLSNYDYSILDRVEGRQFHFGHTIDVGQYPNEVHLFPHNMPEMRDLFQLKDHYDLQAERKLELARSEFLERRKLSPQASSELKDKSCTRAQDIAVVGVHIRRGDYENHLQDLYQIGYVKSDYFLRAMNEFRATLECPIFVFVSDDIQWAGENFGDCAGHCFHVGQEATQLDTSNPLQTGSDIGIDMGLLSKANHSILTYGTFGMWGALLAGGRTILPRGYEAMKEVKEIQRAHLPAWTFL